jgi:hypothetical protein
MCASHTHKHSETPLEATASIAPTMTERAWLVHLNARQYQIQTPGQDLLKKKAFGQITEGFWISSAISAARQ